MTWVLAAAPTPRGRGTWRRGQPSLAPGLAGPWPPLILKGGNQLGSLITSLPGVHPSLSQSRGSVICLRRQQCPGADTGAPCPPPPRGGGGTPVNPKQCSVCSQTKPLELKSRVSFDSSCHRSAKTQGTSLVGVTIVSGSQWEAVN